MRTVCLTVALALLSLPTSEPASAQAIAYTRSNMPMPDDLEPDDLDQSWYSEDLTVGDLDGDGLKDVVVAIRTPIPEHQGTTPRIEVYRQLPGRQFEHVTSITTPINMLRPTYPRPMATCDLDNDGRDELVLTQSFGRKLQIFDLVSGSLVKTAELTEPFELVQQLSCRDLDLDGRPDLFLLSAWQFGAYSYGTAVLKGLGGTSFAAPKVFPIHPNVTGVSLADGNGDGRPEIAYAQIFGLPMVAYALGIPEYFFQIPRELTTDLVFHHDNDDPWFAAATFADLDADGRKEFVVVHQEHFVSGYRYDPSIVTGYRLDPRDESLTLVYRSRIVMTNTNFVNMVFPRDFDGDGDEDLILSYADAFDVVLNQNGILETQERVAIVGGDANSKYSMVSIEDMDGDGCQDIVKVAWAADVLFQQSCVGSSRRQAIK